MGTLIYLSARACGHEVVECVLKKPMPRQCTALWKCGMQSLIFRIRIISEGFTPAYSKENSTVFLVLRYTALREEEDKEMLKETAKVCPVFYSANYSYGVTDDPDWWKSRRRCCRMHLIWS